MSDSGSEERPSENVQDADVALERDVFMRTMLRHLSGTLQDVVGLQEAEGFVSVVGQKIGEEINDGYRRALAVERLTRSEVAKVLVDLKRRIEGDFYVISEDDEKIVFGNRACPFGDKVKGRPALCMMTSNVFGVIAAENLGYARVRLEETIALGHDGCRIVVYLRPRTAEESDTTREYFSS